MPEVKLISEALFDAVAESAAASPRRRMNHNFHSGPADNPHRFLNVLLRGSYIRPHRHTDPPKPETFLVLDGAADLLIFNDDGSIVTRHRLGGDSGRDRIWGVDVPPGLWHTVVPRTERVVCFEVKPGPWEPASDKQFAEWAPAETDASAAEYARNLLG